ncbi:MAG: hemolysin III family protein [Oscillospiraceae bacterium]|nr:hemolysin III family protein [Oscillospiraceae bacterium]
MKRTKLKDRLLPDYTRGEEVMNTVTHIVGGGIGVLVFLFCLWKAFAALDGWKFAGGFIYGVSFILLYTISSVYHALRPGTGKKVLQIIDHCAIYFFIAGTYTPIVLCTLRPAFPEWAFLILVIEYGLAALATTLTAIDLKKYNVLSMICYIGMGWCILIALKPLLQVLAMPGFLLLLSGGIVYTIGAILYGLGTKLRYMHSVFHLFVLGGSILQALCILLYVL